MEKLTQEELNLILENINHNMAEYDKDIKRNIKNKKYIGREYPEEFLNGLYANLNTNL